jgi:hypothetical protein
MINALPGDKPKQRYEVAQPFKYYAASTRDWATYQSTHTPPHAQTKTFITGLAFLIR